MEKKRDAVLFDLDGTLWDSSREVLHCWNRVLRPLGRHVTEAQMAQLMGLTPREIGDLMFPDLSVEERYTLTFRCLDAEPPYLYERGAKLYPSVRETLRELRERYFIGLISNCTEDYALSFLHAHGLEGLFDDHETAGRTGLDKEQNIRLVLERNKIRRAVYIGDTAKDPAAAEAAHIPFIYADWGFGDLDDYQPSSAAFSKIGASVSSVFSL